MDSKTAEATIAGQDSGKNFQNPNLKPRVSLRIAGCLGIREHLGKMCNKFNAPLTLLWETVIHSVHM